MAPAGVAVVFRYGTGEKGKGVEKGRRSLKQPRGLHVCADGTLLVADFGNHCVLRFKSGADAKGKVVAGEEGHCLPNVDLVKDIDRPLGAPEGEGFLMKHPCDVLEGPEGALWVLDNDESRIQSFTKGGGAATQVAPPPTGAVLKSNHAPEALKNPRSACLAPDGGIVICDTWGHRVLRYAPPGSPEAFEKPTVLAGTPNSAGPSLDKLMFPSCVAFGPDGALYVSDTNNHRIQRWAPGSNEGSTVAGSAICVSGSGLGELNMPTGICFDKDCSLLVADRSNARVLRFAAGSTAGDKAELVAGADVVQRPWGVCVSTDGAIYVSDERQAVVLKLGGDELAGAAAPEAEEEEEEVPAAPAKLPEAAPLIEEVKAEPPGPAAPSVKGGHMDLD